MLAYLRSLVGYESAIASRPIAVRRPSTGRPAPLDPGPGGHRSPAYARIPAEHAELLVRGRGSAHLTGDSVQRFFEHWLSATRRAEREAAGGAPRTTWLAGWPTVLIERREELATVFRFSVELEWRRRGAVWELPPRTRGGPRDRPMSQGTPDPPDTLELRSAPAADEDDDGPGLSIDRELLTRFGLLEEELRELDGIADPLRAARALSALLERDGATPGAAPEASSGDPPSGASAPPGPAGPPTGGAPQGPEAVFARLVEQLRERAPGGLSVWPTGIVQDGALLHATRHLERELGDLLLLPARSPSLSSGTALHAYLSGEPAGADAPVPLLGRYRARGLTASQRHAAELALSSTFAAVQGPPGTGKTELILTLAAHALVSRVAGLSKTGRMGDDLLVVASTNNRAVDNVIDPLGAHVPRERLPLALRAGSQDVTLTATASELDRAVHWLEAAPGGGAREALAEALGRFEARHRALLRLLAPAAELAARQRERADLTARLEALAPDPEADRLEEAFARLDVATERMARILTTRKKKKRARLLAVWEQLAGELPALRDRTSPLSRALGLPPELEENARPEEVLEAWADALEGARAVIRAQHARHLTPARRREAERERAKLQARLEELERTPRPEPIDAATERELEALGHELFVLAVEARERWAIAHRSELLPLLQEGANVARELRSLRRWMGKNPAAEGWLRRLYPVMGSTLLSLGNVLEPLPQTIDRLVIDEAGQCHPAYAISGLLRARQALLIGDVHQLAPVSRCSPREEERIAKPHLAKVGAERLAPFRLHDQHETSAQALADRAVRERPTLTDHFRCRREIIAISDALAGYGLTVHEPADRPPRPAADLLPAPVLFVRGPGQQTRARGSWMNAPEAERVVELVARLRDAGLGWGDLAVITPYVGQVEHLVARLRALGAPMVLPSSDDPRPLRTFDPDHLSIGTVHKLQGGERRVVLLSLVLTETRALPFVDDHPNLLNVAVSRAREHLVIFGHEPTLRAGKNTRLLIERATEL